MSKSFVLTHRHKPELFHTLGLDDQFIRVLEVFLINVSEVSQEEFETFLGILSVLHPEISVHGSLTSNYVLRYM